MDRGNQKQAVFIDSSDFDTYRKRLRLYKKRYKFKLYGYCLMKNHIHLLGEIDKKEDLAKFMHGLTRSYTAYFNKKYDKVGQLWQGRFISKIVAKDEYAIGCINYIEHNPVRAGITIAPYDYEWSSYKERVLEQNSKGNLLNSLSL